MDFQNIEVDEFKAKMKEEGAVVLDVRTNPELAEGAVPGYVMINFMEPDFTEKIDALDKSKTYLVYCRSGNRSARACQHMVSTGFSKVYNLLGGIHAWNEAD